MSEHDEEEHVCSEERVPCKGYSVVIDGVKQYFQSDNCTGDHNICFQTKSNHVISNGCYYCYHQFGMKECMTCNTYIPKEISLCPNCNFKCNKCNEKFRRMNSNLCFDCEYSTPCMGYKNNPDNCMKKCKTGVKFCCACTQKFKKENKHYFRSIAKKQ